jgi:hypothetical protein
MGAMSDTTRADADAVDADRADHAGDAPAHEPDDAGHGHGGHDEDGEHAATLGPIDWAAWGAGILGVGAGLVVAVCLYVATTL